MRCWSSPARVTCLPLLRARRRGVRIVQRLDGINWIHRRRRTGPRHFLRAEYGNLILSFIRSRVATHILYQSEFTRRWWNRMVWNAAAAILGRAQRRGSGGVSARRRRRAARRIAVGCWSWKAISAADTTWGWRMPCTWPTPCTQITDFPMELAVVGRADEAQRRRRLRPRSRSADPLGGRGCARAHSGDRPLRARALLRRSQRRLPQLGHRGPGLRIARRGLRYRRPERTGHRRRRAAGALRRRSLETREAGCACPGGCHGRDAAGPATLPPRRARCTPNAPWGSRR